MKLRTKKSLYNILEGIITSVILILSFFILIFLSLNIVYEHTHIKNYSMQPTLNSGVTSQAEDGDIVYVNRFAEFSAGDIVVAKVHWWDNPVIKRLVGCPGDKIQIKDEGEFYTLYNNGNALYSKAKTTVSLHGTPGRGSTYQYNLYLNFLNNAITDNIDVSKNIGEYEGEPCIVLNDNEYFLMGDNWGMSDDCLLFGPSYENEIIGKVDYVVPKGENSFIYLCEFIKTIFTNKKLPYKY